MLLLLFFFILFYLPIGVIFAGYRKAKFHGHAPDLDFMNWSAVNTFSSIMFWPFLSFGYLIAYITDRISDTFNKYV